VLAGAAIEDVHPDDRMEQKARHGAGRRTSRPRA
jgi:hypothetical protein